MKIPVWIARHLLDKMETALMLQDAPQYTEGVTSISNGYDVWLDGPQISYGNCMSLDRSIGILTLSRHLDRALYIELYLDDAQNPAPDIHATAYFGYIPHWMGGEPSSRGGPLSKYKTGKV